ncbi:rRNA maturation RNase YbeY [Melioribacteraceae bacterium 4301-Me]|uniref:rRNA maturation RNase YbeY n=1 Tax=Pyranulibacter aquaticus TaxID=3163344 RepID=UPI0035970516
MIKGLSVYAEKQYKINKSNIHLLIGRLKIHLNFFISYLSINFVNNEQILAINKKFLGHNYFTDVITFNYSKESNNFDGEILISIDEAKKNAKKYKVDLNEEIARLIIHGVLHLLGFDDQNSKKRIIMKSYEDKLININKKYLQNLIETE